mmetsp:Transcript_121586/g.289058  ORF Transcript_121586/g.289058 Transcript_121586/m.289058 type:complete len:211 (+) Transcript_121586:2959-3591(+)
MLAKSASLMRTWHPCTASGRRPPSSLSASRPRSLVSNRKRPASRTGACRLTSSRTRRLQPLMPCCQRRGSIAWPSCARKAPTVIGRWQPPSTWPASRPGMSTCQTFSTAAPHWSRSAGRHSWVASATPTRSTQLRGGPDRCFSARSSRLSSRPSATGRTPLHWAFATAASCWRCWAGCPARRAAAPSCPWSSSRASCTTGADASSRDSAQ